VPLHFELVHNFDLTRDCTYPVIRHDPTAMAFYSVCDWRVTRWYPRRWGFLVTGFAERRFEKEWKSSLKKLN
jgi:hypothetical protein